MHVDGSFDMAEGKLVCCKKHKYGSVELCFQANMNIPFASIVLYEDDRLVEAQSAFEDACKLGDEIVRRWNESQIKK